MNPTQTAPAIAVRDGLQEAGKPIAAVQWHRLFPWLALIGLLAATALIHVGGKSRYGLLYSGLLRSDLNHISGALDDLRVKHYTDAKAGCIYVPRSKLRAARLRLTRSSALEDLAFPISLVGTHNWFFGVTIETELANTLREIQEVDEVQVFLETADNRSFLDGTGTSHALVELRTKDRRPLTPDSAALIRAVLNSSVYGLPPEAIVIVDQTAEDGALATSLHTSL